MQIMRFLKFTVISLTVIVTIFACKMKADTGSGTMKVIIRIDERSIEKGNKKIFPVQFLS